jgi:hypothetical protein
MTDAGARYTRQTFASIKKLDSAKQQEDRPKAACSCCQEARYQTQRISALGDRR